MPALRCDGGGQWGQESRARVREVCVFALVHPRLPSACACVFPTGTLQAGPTQSQVGADGGGSGWGRGRGGTPDSGGRLRQRPRRGGCFCFAFAPNWGFFVTGGWAPRPPRASTPPRPTLAPTSAIDVHATAPGRGSTCVDGGHTRLANRHWSGANSCHGALPRWCNRCCGMEWVPQYPLAPHTTPPPLMVPHMNTKSMCVGTGV